MIQLTHDALQTKQKQEALQKSGGVLVDTDPSDLEAPHSSASDSQYSRPSLQDITPRMKKASRQQPESPVSRSEAARLAKQQPLCKGKHGALKTARKSVNSPGPSFQGSLQSRLNIVQTSTPITPSLVSENSLRAQQLHESDWRDSGESQPEDQLSAITGSLASSNTKSRKSSIHQDRLGELSPSEDISEYRGDVATASNMDSGWNTRFQRSPTPARSPDYTEDADGDLRPQEPSEHPVRPRPPVLDTTTIQDASLPSPSLSPVTAAANLQNRTEYFQAADIESSSPYESFDDNEDHRSATSRSYISGDQRPVSARGDAGVVAQGRFETPVLANGRPASPSLLSIPTMLATFEAMPMEMKNYVMYQLLRRCPKTVLHTVADVVNPALKCDFLTLLPNELKLNIVGHLDVRSLCSAAQVSRAWRHIIDSAERAWKSLLNADGYELPANELQRAIREGWGWQIASRPNDCETDLALSGQIPSDTELSVHSAQAAQSVRGLSVENSEPATTSKRNKRKAGGKSKTKARKQQKRNHDDTVSIDADALLESASTPDGPYAAASAAALAVPYARVGLRSLKNLHLFKSIYKRHHIIRQSWMQDQTKPRHLAFRAHQRHVVTCLQFDTDKILTGSDDTNINVYDTQTGALRAKLEGHEGGVWALQYEGNVLVSGSTDRSVRVWDIEKGKCTQTFQGHTSTVRCLQILMPTQVGVGTDGRPIMKPKQPLIITGSRDSNLRVWKLPKPDDKTWPPPGAAPDDADCPYLVRVLTGHHHSVRAIAAHADTLVSGSYDCSVRVWKISTGETVHRLQGHTQKVYSVVLDHKRNRCISGSMDNLVKVWSLDTGSVLFNLEGHSSLVGLLDLQGDRLVSAAADSTLRIWDPENGYCRSTLSAHTGAITCFQHDGQKVISGSDRTLKMWNVANGEFVKDLLTDLSGVWQVKFNERRCVAAVQRNNLTYIEVRTCSIALQYNTNGADRSWTSEPAEMAFQNTNEAGGSW